MRLRLRLRGWGLRTLFVERMRRVRLGFVNALAQTRAKLRNPRVVTKVHPREDMLTGGPDLRLYFEVGESALQQIQIGLRASGSPLPRRILDLPCGYGRVMRYLRAAWPQSEITAMDLNQDAVDFCASTFGARAVVSEQPLWGVKDIGDQFDLLWCGSLLTHFDEDDWTPVLSYFRDRLASGGALIFTTHGDLSVDLLAGVPSAVSQIGTWVGDYGMGATASDMARRARSTGFAFGHYGMDRGPFGLSVSTPGWVQNKLTELQGLEFVLHQPRGWFRHQDVWTYRRTDSPSG